MKRAMPLLLVMLMVSPAGFSAGLRQSISDVIAATKKLQAHYVAACKQGDPDACDIAKLYEAYIDILLVEQRHLHNSKVNEHLGEAGDALNEALDALTGED